MFIRLNGVQAIYNAEYILNQKLVMPRSATVQASVATKATFIL